MKKFWKALGLAALAAAVPVRFKKDEDTGKRSYQSLLISVDVNTDDSGKVSDIGINIGEGLLTNAISGLVNSKKETVHFADDEPEAAVVEPIEFVELEEVKAEAEEAKAEAEEAKTEAEEAKAEAEEAKAETEEAKTEAEEASAEEPEATEEDFDPEM